MPHITIAAKTTSNGSRKARFSGPTELERSQLTGWRLDQFYTHPAVAARCYASFVERYDPTVFQLVDPSAGKGVFSDIMLADRIAIDLDPQGGNIIRGDFLTADILSVRPVAFVGNPPFGKNSSAAIAFFNRAARSAQVVAFILPRTACKAWFVRQLPLDMHLVHEELIPDGAFIANSQVCSVPTVFQIWERRAALRAMPPARTTHPHFEFTDRGKADFEIQRIGMYAGRIRHKSGAADSSLHYIRAHHPGVEAVMSRIDFSDCTKNNAGNRCVNKEEIVRLYEDLLAGRSGRYRRPLAPLLPDAPHTCHCCSSDWPFR